MPNRQARKIHAFYFLLAAKFVESDREIARDQGEGINGNPRSEYEQQPKSRYYWRRLWRLVCRQNIGQSAVGGHSDRSHQSPFVSAVVIPGGYCDALSCGHCATHTCHLKECEECSCCDGSCGFNRCGWENSAHQRVAIPFPLPDSCCGCAPLLFRQ